MENLKELLEIAAARCSETTVVASPNLIVSKETVTRSTPTSTVSNLASRSQKWLEKRSEHIEATRKQLDEARRDSEEKELLFSPKINSSSVCPKVNKHSMR